MKQAELIKIESNRTSELLGCPFCRSEPDVDRDEDCTIIFCSSCYSNHGRTCDAHALKYEDAVKAWNTRAI